MTFYALAYASLSPTHDRQDEAIALLLVLALLAFTAAICAGLLALATRPRRRWPVQPTSRPLPVDSPWVPAASRRIDPAVAERTGLDGPAFQFPAPSDLERRWRRLEHRRP